MGWIRDTFQEYHIGHAKSVANQTQIKSQTNTTDIGYIDKKIDNLVIITQEIWELLEESGISESQLAKKIQEIDLRDGRADGKVGNNLESCPECGKKPKIRRANCFWCGAKLPAGSILSKTETTLYLNITIRIKNLTSALCRSLRSLGFCAYAPRRLCQTCVPGMARN